MTTAGISGAATAVPFFGAVQTKAKAQATTVNGSTDSGDNSLSAGNLGTTFLNLLVQELQNQDPTSPMDPTAMVGQMISLNQLDQLIGINQTLNPSATSATGSGSTTDTAHAKATASASSPKTQAESTSPATMASTLAALDPSQASASLAGAQSATAAALAAQNAAANPAAPLNLGNLNTLFGGK